MIVTSIIFLGVLIATGWANPLLNGYCRGPHEIYSMCGDNCAGTCRDPYPRDCVKSCHEGCFCEPGYIRDDFLGTCVVASECSIYKNKPKRCGPNEKLKKCKRTCEPTCKHRRPQECSDEVACVDYGCQCRDGFVRDNDGDCIPYDMCPDKRESCRKNEVWSNETCVPEAKCQEPRCKNQKFSKECPRYCTNGGCVCKKGYVRTNKGKCVKEDDCYESDDSDKDSSPKSRDRSEDSDDDSEDWDSDRSGRRDDSFEDDCSGSGWRSIRCRNKSSGRRCRGRSCIGYGIY